MDDAPDWLEIKQFYFESDQCMVLESLINHSKPPQRRERRAQKKKRWEEREQDVILAC